MQSRGLPASPFVPGAQCEHHVLSSGCISLSFGGIVAQFCRRRQCFVFCNTRDCIWKRKIGIGLFEDKSKFLYLLIDAHSDSDCMTFLLSLQKINKFYQLRNSKRRMLLVMEKAFSALLDIQGLIVGMLVTFSYAQVAMYVFGLCDILPVTKEVM